MNDKMLFVCGLLVSATVVSAAELAAPLAFEVSPLMKTYAGEEVKTLADWETVRRPEIRERILTRMYGKRPKAAERPPVSIAAADPDREMLGGSAIRKRVRITGKGPYGDHAFVATAFIPKAAKPVGSFVLICNRSAIENLDPERKKISGFWPVEEIVARGYAAIAFAHTDVAPETYNPATAFLSGVFPCFERPADRTDESWGTLSAWAWGASRVLDWIGTEPTLDARHVAVVGHSRGGKTSLLAGVTDERFAMTCVNDSGCGGAKLAALDLPESEYYAIFLASRVTYWFCGNFQKFCMNHDRPPPGLGPWKDRYGILLEPLGFDQHQWAALVAPRLLAIASATDDPGAGPRGEFETAHLASPAWGLYGKRGLVGTAFPKPDTPLQEGFVSYHLRTGEHNLTPYDWKCYMDFADRHDWPRR